MLQLPVAPKAMLCGERGTPPPPKRANGDAESEGLSNGKEEERLDGGGGIGE